MAEVKTRSTKRLSPLRRLAVGSPLRKPKQPGEMNGLEAAYSKELDRLGYTWLYERFTLTLRHGGKGVKGLRYTPDFVVFGESDAEMIEFHEVKGFRRAKNIAKLKVAAELYPQFRFYLVTRKDGEWIVEEY